MVLLELWARNNSSGSDTQPISYIVWATLECDLRYALNLEEGHEPELHLQDYHKPFEKEDFLRLVIWQSVKCVAF